MNKVFLIGLLFYSAVKSAAEFSRHPNSKEFVSTYQESISDNSHDGSRSKTTTYRDSDRIPFAFREDWYRPSQDGASKLPRRALPLKLEKNSPSQQFSSLDENADDDALSNPTLAKRTLLERVRYYKRKGNPNKEATSYERLADSYFKNPKVNDDHYKKIKYYQVARSLYLDNQNAVGAARVLTKIASHRIILKQFDKAEKDLQESLAEYKAAGFNKLQNTFMTLVDLHYAKGNFYRALYYCLEGIKNMAPGESIRYSSYFYWNAARCNFGTKHYQDALKWLEKAISIDKNYPDFHYLTIDILLTSNRLEEALAKINEVSKSRFSNTSWDRANLYRCLALYNAKKNNTSLCVQYYLRSLKTSRNIFGEGGYSWKIICFNGIAEAYLKANQAEKAKRYINNAALIFKQAESEVDPALLVSSYNNSHINNDTTGDYRAAFKNARTPLTRGLLLAYYKNSYEYETATRNYPAAIQRLQQHHTLYDSISTLDKNYRIAELNLQYESTQRELFIKNLKSEAVVQHEKLKTANMERNITTAGILVMVLVSTLLYRYYIRKKKVSDIINRKNILLQHLLTEKEWLLKEVHHRVKNNLHTVICLLESQAKYLENDALKAFENSQHRIYAMSLIHQQLYQSDDIKTIDMSNYIPELVSFLETGFGTSNEIRFQTNIEPIHIPLSHAIPLGLIINEAITNSIKYAFPNNRSGQITICLQTKGNRIQLELSDDGIGMPQINHDLELESLGLRLIKGLGDDISADTTFTVDHGTKITVAFSLDPFYNSEKINSLLVKDQNTESPIFKPC